MTSPLRRNLGLAAVIAVVMGDMLGSGIFFTLGELASLFPRAGATYHIMSEAFGPGWGFVKAWMEAWVSAPGSIAGIAIVFGEFVAEFLGEASGPPQLWAVVAVAVFASINLMGVRWGGRTQVTLTTIKITGVLTLVIGSFFFAEAVAPSAAPASSVGLAALLRFVGIGVAAVFFTYDGWTDVTHVAGEVANPKKTLPLGLGLGVFGIMVLYLIVNLAFLRVMPLAVMREQGATVAITLGVDLIFTMVSTTYRHTIAGM